jgi:hypothetical protein
MPKIEVDEDEWNRNEGIRKTVAAIAADPKRRAQLEKLHKEVDPNIKTPTLDTEKAVVEPVEAVRKEFEDYKKSQADEAAKAQQDALRARQEAEFEKGRRWMQDNKWTPEGIEAVEKIMAEKGILDHKIAAAYFEKENPPQPPAMPGGTGSWNFLDLPTDESGDVDIKNLIQSANARDDGRMDRVASKMAGDALSEFRQARGRR